MDKSYVRSLELILCFADGLAISCAGYPLADLYSADCEWAQKALEKAGCHPRTNSE